MLQFRLISVCNKPPTWVHEGYSEYSKRLSPVCRLEIVEIPIEKRGKQKNPKPSIDREGEKMLALIKPTSTVIALDIQGQSWTTKHLSVHLQNWMQEGKSVDFLIGGPDGLALACLKRAQFHWSLSALTLPHLFVRILLAEQLYRAWTILKNHPYHK